MKDGPSRPNTVAVAPLATAPGSARGSDHPCRQSLSAPWNGFNLGMNCGDQPARVEQARHHVEKLLQADHPVAWLKQVHGKRVIRAEDADNEADGVWTDQQRWPCVVLTADCLPVLLARTDGSAVAAVHAGWRGLQAGIIAQGVSRIAPKGEPVSAWLGPAICGKCYQVGDEVYRAFVDTQADFKDAFHADATPTIGDFPLPRRP